MFSVLLAHEAGEQVDRALHLSLAALLGNDIYNFGELVGDLYLNLTFSFPFSHTQSIMHVLGSMHIVFV